MKNKYMTCIGLFCGLLVFGSLTGCGNKTDWKVEVLEVEQDVNYLPDAEVEQKKNNENEQNNAFDKRNTNANNYGLKDEKIPNRVNCVLNKGGHKEFDIDAEVNDTGYDNLHIYKMVSKNMTEEELIAFATSFFDNGRFEKQLPYDYWKKDAAREEYERLEDLEKAAEDGYVIDYDLMERLSSVLDESQSEWDGSEVDLVYSEIFYCDRNKESENEELHLFTELRGKVNGKEYLLDYSCDGKGKEQRLEILPLFPVSFSGGLRSEQLMEGLGENSCDKESLKKTATEIVNALDEDFVLGVTSDFVAIDDVNGEYFYDGMNMSFMRKINEKPAGLCYFMTTNEEDYDVSQVSHNLNQEEMTVTVNEDGDLVYLYYDANQKIEDSQEEVKLLPFVCVLKAADDYLAEEVERWNIDFCSDIHEIRLEYMMVEYDEKVMYMPFWVFVSDEPADEGTDADTAHFNSIVVNAVDGECQLVGCYMNKD